MADDILKEAQEAFSLCQDRERDNRARAEEDIRFARLEEQWPTGVKQQREKEGRPCLTINKLAPVIRQVVNDSRQNKPAIKVMPQDSGSDPETAEIMSGLIRNIEACSDADVAYDTAVECAVVGGLGYFRIGLEYAHDDTFEQDLVIQRVSDPFSIYGDPYSTAADSSDWNLAFVSEMMPKKEFKRKYKTDAIDWDGFAEWPMDWCEGDLVRVAEYWTREEITRKIVLLTDGSVVPLKQFEARLDEYQAAGITVQGAPRDAKAFKVTQRLLSGSEVLETTDWLGKFIPIVPVIGDEVFIDGKRHYRSLIRSAKDAQRMFNYWRTQATEMVALAPKAPFIGPKGAFDTDAEKWATANTISHSHIEYDGQVAPQRQAFAGVAAGALQEAMNAADDIKATTGIYDASLGAKSNETSGRAILARQREGDVSTFHFIDNLARAIRHGGRILIDMIPHVYSSDRVVRTLGEDGTPKTVPVNQPIQVQGPDGQPKTVKFDLTAGKYDLTVSAGPSYTTRREEAATQMMEFVQAFPQAAPVIGDLLAKNMDWPGADEIAKRLKALLPPPAQGQNPQVMQMQQQIQQMQQQGQVLQQELQAVKADQSVKQAEVQLKAKEIEIKAFEAETDRMKIVAEINRPDPEPIERFAAE